MKIRYDAETDTLTLKLRDVAVRESARSLRCNLDYDGDGNLAGLEILDASAE